MPGEVEKFYRGLNLNQIYSSVKPTYNRIYAPEPGRLVADLIDVSNFAPYNHDIKHNSINTHSRYAWSYGMKNKKPISVRGD